MGRTITSEVLYLTRFVGLFRGYARNRRHASSAVSTVVCALIGAAAMSGCAAADTVSFTLKSPYEFGDHQHKVQLHTHTTNSDGEHSPQWVMREYAKRGYAAVAITDHDYPERTNPSLDDPGEHSIIHIPGVEYSADEQNRGWNHMLGIMIKTIHHENGIHDRQAQINQAKAEGGLAYLCHPYDDNIHRRGWSNDDLISMVTGYDGIEIHNGAVYHDPGGRDYPYKVDLALVSGRRINVIAVDDFHRNPSETMDRGYVIVNSRADRDMITRESIITALQSGNYFSAGRLSTSDPVSPRFTDIRVRGHEITVQTDKPADIEFITARNNYYSEGANYSHMQKGVTRAGYTVSHLDQFVRIKATYREGGRESYTWSNPIYVVIEGD